MSRKTVEQVMESLPQSYDGVGVIGGGPLSESSASTVLAILLARAKRDGVVIRITDEEFEAIPKEFGIALQELTDNSQVLTVLSADELEA